METRITSKLVCLRRPLILSGMDGIHPPGTYIVRIEEEMLHALSLVGWRQRATTPVLHRGGGVEYVAIDAQESRDPLVRHGKQGDDPPADPSAGASRNQRVWGGRL